MTKSRSHSFSSQSDLDTSSLTTSTSTPLSTTSKESALGLSTTSALAAELLRKSLTQRPLRSRRARNTANARTPDNTGEMFTSRKYTPLPTSSNPQRKRVGGMPTWKRYGFIATAVFVVIVLGYGFTGGSKDEAVWNADQTYTPDLDESMPAADGVDYTSPPFRPLDSDIAEPQVDGHHGMPGHLPTPAEEEEESSDDLFHALPIDVSDDSNNDVASSNPHDQLSNEATEAEEANPDFTEITDEEALPAVHSFETDPDAATTTHCEDPYDETRPLVQYALTIDAGSTGSRIHVYKFHNCGPSPQLEYETFKSIQPGLSAYARDPTAAAASLDPLLEEALRVVPKELHKCTPVEVKATAGLRLLGASESEAILDEVRNRLETNFDFVVPGERAVEIMDGKDEGVYAWITANYLLNKIGEGSVSGDTLAVMDLGGASTQIVFEPSFPADSEQSLVEGEHKYSLSFGGKQYTLYQHSYLGYGLMRARRSVHNLIAFTWSFGQGANIDWDDLSEDAQVPNPCLSRGTTRTVELDPPGRKSVNVTMHGAVGGFEACNRVVELVMAKDAICEVKPCSFNGVYQPSLLDTFPNGQFLALSYFTDRIQPLLQKTGEHITIADVTSLAKDVCAGPVTWDRRWGSNAQAMTELQDRPEYCLDLTFMNALLGLGYELQPQRELLVEKKLKGVELGWALGAGLALVEKAELTCTA